MPGNYRRLPSAARHPVPQPSRESERQSLFLLWDRRPGMPQLLLPRSCARICRRSGVLIAGVCHSSQALVTDEALCCARGVQSTSRKISADGLIRCRPSPRSVCSRGWWTVPWRARTSRICVFMAVPGLRRSKTLPRRSVIGSPEMSSVGRSCRAVRRSIPPPLRSRALLSRRSAGRTAFWVCMNTAGRPATELVRRVLRDEGQPDAIVRLARPEDPAPTGAIMYAVTLRDGLCLVGYAMAGRGVMESDVSGALSDGRCLAP